MKILPFWKDITEVFSPETFTLRKKINQSYRVSRHHSQGNHSHHQVPRFPYHLRPCTAHNICHFSGHIGIGCHHKMPSQWILTEASSVSKHRCQGSHTTYAHVQRTTYAISVAILVLVAITKCQASGF